MVLWSPPIAAKTMQGKRGGGGLQWGVWIWGHVGAGPCSSAGAGTDRAPVACRLPAGAAGPEYVSHVQ